MQELQPQVLKGIDVSDPHKWIYIFWLNYLGFPISLNKIRQLGIGSKNI